jgi:YesN/AraC family two-component response regulator
MQKKEYQLMIVDLNMPHMNGEELVQKIRETNDQVAFIIFTKVVKKSLELST